MRLPRGQGVIAALRADNSSDAARLLKLLVWDCSGHYTQRLQQEAVIPVGATGHTVRFWVPQLFDDQCLLLQSIPPPEGATGQWTLQALSLVVDEIAERAGEAVRAERAEALPIELETIAHAGGALEGRTYANSIATLERSLAAGFIWFELDFQWTADGELVCGHDWGPTLLPDLGLTPDVPPTLAQFLRAVGDRADAPCTVDALRDWLATHPQARIVTDLKERALDGLRVLAERIPNHGQRLIAQVYQPEELAQAQALGYQDIIWTLYRYRGGTREVLDALMRIAPMAITMDQGRLAAGLGLTLQRADVPVFVHTVNDAGQAQEYLAHWGATGIYTDTLAPPLLEPLKIAERAESD